MSHGTCDARWRCRSDSAYAGDFGVGNVGNTVEATNGGRAWAGSFAAIKHTTTACAGYEGQNRRRFQFCLRREQQQWQHGPGRRRGPGEHPPDP